jgi:hypothetical protein
VALPPIEDRFEDVLPQQALSAPSTSAAAHPRRHANAAANRRIFMLPNEMHKQAQKGRILNSM